MLPVLCHLDTLRLGTDDIDTVRLQGRREVQRCLTAKLYDRSPALLLLIDVQYIFQGQRLKIEFVAGIVVGRDRLRIRVYHHSLESFLFERERGVDATVIKLDSLSDAIWSATKYHHPAAVSFPNLILLSVGGVIVWGVSFKLGRESIDEPVGRQYRCCMSLFPYLCFGTPTQVGNLSVGKAETFGCAQR